MSAGAPEERYPEGKATPKGLTTDERDSLAATPLRVERGGGAPTGNVRAVAEYEPMEAILVAYEGPSSWRAVLRDMGRHITTTGDADLIVMCDSAGEASTARSEFIAAGADSRRVVTKVRQTDTIWMRDYGPRYIYESGIRAIVDHTYNRPRPNDNLLPSFFGADRGETVYTIPLIHGGGNYHLDAIGGAASTRLIVNENPGLGASQIVRLWRDYQNVETELFDALPAFVDSTQHIDMWMQIVSDDTIVISDWPLEPGSSWDTTCDTTAAFYEAAGWNVTRTPAVRSGGTHYTFTNVVMCNDLVLIPEYDNIPSVYSQQALAAWEATVPDKTVVQVDCDALVTAAGVMHCIVMHVPANSGGADPVAWVTAPKGGVYDAGDPVTIAWRTDDDEGVTAIDIFYRAGSGQPYEQIASGIADTGSFEWIAPILSTQEGTILVVARDAEGNTGSDETDTPIVVVGDPCVGTDLTGDGDVDLGDFGIFGAAFGSSAGDPSWDPRCDFDGDGDVDLGDFGLFGGQFGRTGC
ncbi:MAG: agmatine deiminase family protein [Planctomycetota bacterium]